MNRLSAFLSKRRTGDVLAISVIAIFLILSMTRFSAFDNTLSIILGTAGDDWKTYAQYGLNIKHDGILMPALKEPFPISAFLYPYFIALCFVIFGETTVPIFIIQHFLLGLSVALTYWTFRDKMKNITGLLFLCAMFIFALLDVYKYYSVRLLSENLALFTTASFFYCIIKGLQKNNRALQLAAAMFLGISILIRTNMVLYAIVLVLVILPYYLKQGRRGFMGLLLFISVLVLSSSLLLIRNYIVCKKPIFLPAATASVGYLKLYHRVPPSVDLSRVYSNALYTKMHLDKDIVSYVEYVLQRPDMFFWYYFKHLLFCFGFLSFAYPAYRTRPHWVVMWIGYFTYIFLRFREHTKFEMWEIAVHLYIAIYYGSLILSATQLGNYGFRMLVPATNFVLVFSFLALDRLNKRSSLNGEK